MDQIIRGKIPKYKGIELAATIGITIEESASKITQEMENDILKAINLTTGREIKIDKEQLIRWINMCKFLEEQATEEDRRALGAWFAEVDISQMLSKAQARVAELEEQIESIRKIVGKC